MERLGKTSAIFTAAGLPGEQIKSIITEDDHFNRIKEATKAFITSSNPEDTHYMVNLTGGTKMMAMAVYDYFQKHSSSFYYLPIGKNEIIRMDGDLSGTRDPVKTRLTLFQYLKASGIAYSEKEVFTFSEKDCNLIFNEYKKRCFNFEAFPVTKALKIANTYVKEENVRGEWFEEFVYYRIKQQLELPLNSISTSVKIYKDKVIPYNDNEFDVMFVYENKLFVIECKVNLSTGNTRTKLDQTLYKLGAISKNFGLQTESYIFTMAKLRNRKGELNKRLLRKCEVLKIQPPIDNINFLNGIDYSKLFKYK